MAPGAAARFTPPHWRDGAETRYTGKPWRAHAAGLLMIAVLTQITEMIWWEEDSRGGGGGGGGATVAGPGRGDALCC